MDGNTRQGLNGVRIVSPERTVAQDVLAEHSYLLKAGDGVGADYTVVEALGAGSMGEVYRVRNRHDNKEYALKLLSPELASDERMVQQFHVEARVLADLHHPNIVRLYHHSEDAGTGLPFLTMEYVCGPGGRPVSLQEELASMPGRRLPEVRVRRYALELCGALAYAHALGEEGVVHRDLKPGNILIGQDEGLRVTDFGLVKVLGSDYARAVTGRSLIATMRQRRGSGSSPAGETGTSDQTLVGNLAFMSPEQKDGGEATTRSDLYAAGAITYTILTGKRPEGKWKEPSELGFSRAWDRVVDACLQTDPKDRVGSADELRALVERTGRGGRPSDVGSRQFKKGALWLAAAVFVALGFGVYRAYGTYSVRRAEERAKAEQASRLDVAQRARVAELRGAAEAALASDDLEAAGAKIAELKNAGVATAELEKKYESRAGERETNRRYAAASVAHEAAQKLDAGQGFGEKLKAMEVAWREAEAARQVQGWGQALSGYDAVLAACKAMAGDEISREDAKTRKAAAEKAQSTAAQAGSASAAAELYAAGGRASSRAAEAFEKGDFVVACNAWQEASQSYASAQTRALAVQAYAQAKSAFEAELSKSGPAAGGRASPRAALLDAHGGPKWSEVNRLQTLGAASTNDPAAGERVYRDALAALTGAVEEAQAAERAESERLAAEAQAREEKVRQEKADAALAAARQAKVAGLWQACIERAAEALALESGGRGFPRVAVTEEAGALKREAEGNLVPTLTVEVEAGSRAVAVVSDGSQTWTTPATISMREGQKFSFYVSGRLPGNGMSSTKLECLPATLSGTVDWKGPRKQNVIVREITIPAGGDPKAVSWTVINRRWVKNTYANGDVTMKDRDTGNMWLYDASAGGKRGWDDAVSYCASLSYAGYSDWKLPDQASIGGQCSQQKFFVGVAKDSYWSSKSVGYLKSAYFVNMANGVSMNTFTVLKCFVWPVRYGD